MLVRLACLVALLASVALAEEREQAGPLGVRLDKDAETAEVYEVIRGTPAAKLGIRKGDVILRVDGQPTPTPQALVQVLRSKPRFTGDALPLEVQRGEELLQLEATLTARPTLVGEPAPPWAPTRWGNLAEGQEPPTLESLKGKVVVLFCYQSW